MFVPAGCPYLPHPSYSINLKRSRTFTCLHWNAVRKHCGRRTELPSIGHLETEATRICPSKPPEMRADRVRELVE
jgi:hypothetical protein